jgi:glycosyltransferase involved in cell wall biosynthesis
MASGLPVVASRVGGMPEVVEHGVTGYLAPVGDVEAMAEFSLKILSDCETRKRFGEAARERAVRLFDWHAVVPQYEEIYQRVVGDAR